MEGRFLLFIRVILLREALLAHIHMSILRPLVDVEVVDGQLPATFSACFYIVFHNCLVFWLVATAWAIKPIRPKKKNVT